MSKQLAMDRQRHVEASTLTHPHAYRLRRAAPVVVTALLALPCGVVDAASHSGRIAPLVAAGQPSALRQQQQQQSYDQRLADSLAKRRRADSIRFLDSIAKARAGDSAAAFASLRRRQIRDSLRLDSIFRATAQTTVQADTVRDAATRGQPLLDLQIVRIDPDRASLGEQVAVVLRTVPPLGDLDLPPRWWADSLRFDFRAPGEPAEKAEVPLTRRSSAFADSMRGDTAFIAVPGTVSPGGRYEVVASAFGLRSSPYPFATSATGMRRVLQIATERPAILLVPLILIAGAAGAAFTARRQRAALQRRLEQEKAELARKAERERAEQERLSREQLERAEREREDTRRELEQLRFEKEFGARSSSAKGSSAKANVEHPVRPPLPGVPDELVEACAAGSCVLFTGSGLAAQSGLPTARMILDRLLRAAASREGFENLDELHAALDEGKYPFVAEVIAARLPRDLILETIEEMFGPRSDELPQAYVHLRDIPFTSAISASWDNLVEQTFKRRSPIVLYPTRADVPPQAMSDGVFRIAKPFGALDPRDTFLFHSAESQRAIQGNRAFQRVLTSMALSKTLFFIGTSVRTIDEFFTGLHNKSERQHYAFVPYEPDWTLQTELFEKKFRVRLLGYTPSPGFPEVIEFLRQLEERVAEARPGAERSAISPATLSEVTLTNVGVFEKLTLTFNANWNVLLGNNGSGKSTLLRAIALGLCGEDADAAKSASKLLRVGTTSGSIQLRVGDTTYRTELNADGGKLILDSTTFTPLQKGSWVVLGFPPLRGVSTRNPSGAQKTGSPVPVVEDLLPLIRGSTDNRLDNLKQWIVNLDAGSRSENGSAAARSGRLLTAFFDVLKKLTPGVAIDFGKVTDDGTFDVLVRTEDGLVPIDQVSQGMSSIFGWVGTMLQRMYEIHDSSPHPEHEPALILVDELDAHLHPEWQQRIVGLMREHFPKLQIIATSHSPLVVAGMKANEVLIARRDFDDPMRVEIAPAPIDFEGMRADQILTSPLFGLASTRSDQTNKEIERYTALRGTAKNLTQLEMERFATLQIQKSPPPGKPALGRTLSAAEDAELEALRAKSSLDSSAALELAYLWDGLTKVLHPAETDAQRQVVDAVSQVLRQRADPGVVAKGSPSGEMTPEMRVELQRRLELISPAAAKSQEVQPT